MNHVTTYAKRFHPAGPYWHVWCTAKDCKWEIATASRALALKGADKHEKTGK